MREKERERVIEKESERECEIRESARHHEANYSMLVMHLTIYSYASIAMNCNKYVIYKMLYMNMRISM